MTTELKKGKNVKIKMCKKHKWLYMKTIIEEDKIGYAFYCPECLVKILQIPDYTEKEWFELEYKELEKYNTGRLQRKK